MRQPTFAPTRHALAFAILTALSAPALAQNAAAYAVFAYLAASADGGFGSAPKPAETAKP